MRNGKKDIEDKIIRSEVEKVKKRVEALEKELVRNKNNLFFRKMNN
jgi:hypothetical protein